MIRILIQPLGLALHKTSHIVKTDFESLKDFLHQLRYDNVPSDDIMNIKSIFNYIGTGD